MKVWILVLSIVSLVACTHTPEFEQQQTSGFSYKSLHNKVFFAGQPTVAQLKAMQQDRQLEVVINLRHPSELTEKMPTYEQDIKTTGLTYYNIPVMKDGELDRAAIASVEATFMNHHRKGQKILVHCGSGQRVGAWLATHLHYHHKDSIQKSISLANDAGMTNPNLKMKTVKFLEAHPAPL